MTGWKSGDQKPISVSAAERHSDHAQALCPTRVPATDVSVDDASDCGEDVGPTGDTRYVEVLAAF